jgi:hypothetical protein
VDDYVCGEQLIMGQDRIIPSRRFVYKVKGNPKFDYKYNDICWDYHDDDTRIFSRGVRTKYAPDHQMMYGKIHAESSEHTI